MNGDRRIGRGWTWHNEEARKDPSKLISKEDKELKALYAQYKRDFTAADLQKYTEIEEGIPLEQVIKEMEEIHGRFNEKQANRKRA